MRYTKRALRGLSMIEVLVTTVVLALGILGTSALQLTGIKGTDSAHYRTVATLLANEMAERIRTNTAAVELGEYATNPEVPISCNDQPAGFLDCNTLACTPSQLAIFDKFQLTCGHIKKNGAVILAKSSGVANELPNGSLTISCGAETCDTGVDHIITLSWTERTDEAGQDSSASIVLTITP